MELERECEGCGVRYVAKTKRSRFHDERCAERSRKRRKRAGGDVVPIRSSGAVRSTVEVTQRALEEADRLETPDGVAAMRLAEKLDAGGDTGSAMAALSKEYRSTMAAATANIEEEADIVRDLEQRRGRRLGLVGS